MRPLLFPLLLMCTIWKWVGVASCPRNSPPVFASGPKWSREHLEETEWSAKPIFGRTARRRAAPFPHTYIHFAIPKPLPGLLAARARPQEKRIPPPEHICIISLLPDTALSTALASKAQRPPRRRWWEPQRGNERVLAEYVRTRGRRQRRRRKRLMRAMHGNGPSVGGGEEHEQWPSAEAVHVSSSNTGARERVEERGRETHVGCDVPASARDGESCVARGASSVCHLCTPGTSSLAGGARGAAQAATSAKRPKGTVNGKAPMPPTVPRQPPSAGPVGAALAGQPSTSAAPLVLSGAQAEQSTPLELHPLRLAAAVRDKERLEAKQAGLQAAPVPGPQRKNTVTAKDEWGCVACPKGHVGCEVWRRGLTSGGRTNPRRRRVLSTAGNSFGIGGVTT